MVHCQRAMVSPASRRPARRTNSVGCRSVWRTPVPMKLYESRNSLVQASTARASEMIKTVREATACLGTSKHLLDVARIWLVLRILRLSQQLNTVAFDEPVWHRRAWLSQGSAHAGSTPAYAKATAIRTMHPSKICGHACLHRGSPLTPPSVCVADGVKVCRGLSVASFGSCKQLVVTHRIGSQRLRGRLVALRRMDGCTRRGSFLFGHARSHSVHSCVVDHLCVERNTTGQENSHEHTYHRGLHELAH